MKDGVDVTTGHPEEAPKDNVDVEPVLEALGPSGLYHVIQLILLRACGFLITVPHLGVVFIGYRPPYRCSDLNSTQLHASLGQNVSTNATVSLEYQKCSIDVTLNTSGIVTTQSLSCVNGIRFSMPSDTSFLTEWSLVCDKAGLTELTQTLYMVGNAIGSLFFGGLADTFGRKKVYMCCSLSALVILSAAFLAPNYYVFLVSRVLTGIVSSGMWFSSYTMFMELIPYRWRSAASGIDGTLWASGCVAMATIAYLMRGMSWRLMNLALTAGFAYSLLLPFFLDESVRWLMATGNIKEVERILQKACRLNGKDFHHVKQVLQEAISESRNKKQNPSPSPGKAASEDMTLFSMGIPCHANLGGANTSGHALQMKTGLEELSLEDQTDVEKQNISAYPSVTSEHADTPNNELLAEVEVRPARYTALDICKNRILLLHVAVLTFFWTTINLFYYGAMLGSVSLAGNRYLNFGLMSLLEGVGSVFAAGVMPRVNRRTVGTLSEMVTSLSVLFSIAVMQLVSGSLGKTLASVGWFVGMFSVCMSYCVLNVLCMEVFPTNIRSTGAAIAGSISKLSGMLTPFVVSMGEDTPWAPGLLIGCLCFLATPTIRLLPETRHRKLPTTVEDIMA